MEKEETLDELSVKAIWTARNNIRQLITNTPFHYSQAFSEKAGSDIYLKLENLQHTGSFKLRGAANKILSLSAEEKDRGITTFSTGNHGLAVAYIAKKMGIKAIVCVSKRVPQVKVDAIERASAQIELIGNNQDDAEAHCYQLHEKQGMTVIKPFDDPKVIAGQGTIGFEMMEKVPDLDALVIPLSGGGLISGIALALKSINPHIKIIGVSMEKSAVMYESIKMGRPVVLQEQDTFADSLLGGIGLNNAYTFSLVQKHVDDIVLISEAHIQEAMLAMIEYEKQIIEGAAAVGLGAILTGKISSYYKKIGVVITGNNLDAVLFFKTIQRERLI